MFPNAYKFQSEEGIGIIFFVGF